MFEESYFIRYSRHLIMPEVGPEGQKKISSSSVLVVGAGGLGCPALLYLAAAGVGKIGIVDFDYVEKSNLQRQILYSEHDIGKKKAVAAARRVSEMNSEVNVVYHDLRLDSSNANEIIKDYDVVIDGTDNFQTRYLINDVCSNLLKPFVYASIFRLDGQLAVFDPASGPCYRCLFPSPPPPDTVPTCADGGVLGVLPGIIGSMQALEAIKIILGMQTTKGYLLLFDSNDLSITKVRIEKDPDCTYCGATRKPHELIDYDSFCGLTKVRDDMLISPTELMSLIKSGKKVKLIDVREEEESRLYSIDGSLNIPLSVLPSKVNSLDSSEDIVVFCHTGIKGARAARMLRSIGFKKVRNLSGGVLAWAAEVERNRTH